MEKELKNVCNHVNNITDTKSNSCTQEFLDKYYDGDTGKWLKDNETNIDCRNCFGCRDCNNCKECKDCYDCEDCKHCEYCNGCKNCNESKSCKYVSDGDNLKNHEDIEHLYDKPLTDNSKQALRITLLHKGYEEFKQAIDKLPDYIIRNGCTVNFLKEYYDDDIEKFIEDNKTNKQCFNCRGCENCDNCKNCEDCEQCFRCVFCYGCDFLKQCENCVNCGSCENCKGCENNCFGCKYCNDCSSCVYCYNKNNLHNTSGDDCKNNNYMTSKEFKEVVEEQLEYCKNLLFKKNEEYVTTDDVFENFRTGANMLGTDIKNTLLGYLTKHLVSIISMIKDDKQYDIDKWNEKIGDSINYFLLLKGMVVEEHNK